MTFEGKAGTKTIQGWVTAIEWDEDDLPTVVIIQTEDGIEYLVEETDAADGLLDLEDARVAVTGMVDESDPEGPTISVSAFEILDDTIEWDDDEDDEDDDEDDDGPDVDFDDVDDDVDAGVDEDEEDDA